jgi:hypothetical protein
MIDEKNQIQAKFTKWNCRAEKIHRQFTIWEGLLCEPIKMLWTTMHVFLFLGGLKSVQQEFMCFWRCPRKHVTTQSHGRSLLRGKENKKNTSKPSMRFKNKQYAIICVAADVSKERHGPTHVSFKVEKVLGMWGGRARRLIK